MENAFFAVMKRELKAYFYSPVAYALTGVFTALTGYFFYSGMVFYGMASFEMSRMAEFAGPQELNVNEFILRPLFGNMAVILLLISPLITMRLFSEEKKSGSIEMLFTWPIRDIELTLGKYFAALLMLVSLLVPTVIYLGFVGYHAQINWGVVFSAYLGLLLLGSAFIALGVFVSTLTENQIISSAISFGALLMFWVIAWSVGESTGPLAETLKYLSILERLDTFAKGVVDTKDIVYYLSFIFVFIFLTLRSLESKKWRG